MRLRAGACAGLLTVGLLGGCSSSKVPSAVTDTSKPCVDRWIALLNSLSVKEAKAHTEPKAIDAAAKKLAKGCPLTDFTASDRAKMKKEVNPELLTAAGG